MASGKVANYRYKLQKLFSAGHEALVELSVAQEKRSAKSNSSFGESFKEAAAKFTQAYDKPMTMTMAIAGTAMAPNLNKAALKDRTAVERLVVRLLPRASSSNVFVGDVVAFHSPLSPPVPLSGPIQPNVLVRRVAAVEGDAMSNAGEDVHVPSGHCWLLADNSSLDWNDVIDSRKFGFVPFSSILGRIIYSAASPQDHAKVMNSSVAGHLDEAVVEEEVDIKRLFPTTASSGSER